MILLSYSFQESHLFEVRDVENKRIRMEKQNKKNEKKKRVRRLEVGFIEEMKGLSA